MPRVGKTATPMEVGEALWLNHGEEQLVARYGSVAEARARYDYLVAADELRLSRGYRPAVYWLSEDVPPACRKLPAEGDPEVLRSYGPVEGGEEAVYRLMARHQALAESRLRWLVEHGQLTEGERAEIMRVAELHPWSEGAARAARIVR